MKPPALALALLQAVAGEAWAESVAGDLEEEFREIYARDSCAGTRWYVWQVLRSLTPLTILRARSGEMRQCASVALLSVAVPLLLLDRLWCFIYSQVPMKDGVGRALAFLAINVAAACLGAAVTGGAEGSRRDSAAKAVALAAAAGVAMWISTGASPRLYAVLLLLAVPASCLIASRLRRTV